jgi:hypothetical protein
MGKNTVSAHILFDYGVHCQGTMLPTKAKEILMSRKAFRKGVTLEPRVLAPIKRLLHTREEALAELDEMDEASLAEIQAAIDDLVASGHLKQKRDTNGDPVFRPNSEGVLQPVWVATGKSLSDS